MVDTIKEWYSCIKKYDYNIKNLVEKHNQLLRHKVDITSKIDREKGLKKPTQVTEGWLDDVNKLEEEEWLKQLVDEDSRIRKDQCCFGRMHYNLRQRYKMSKAATKYAQKIKTLINRTPSINDAIEPIPRSDLKSIPTEFLKTLQSRNELMEKVMDKLRDDQVNVVGIFGMGAIGKTTLVKEIVNKGMKDKFEDIVMVEISEAPNIERIQDQIAEQLGKESSLGGVHSTQERATRLYNSLKNSKILLILDNVWAKLDLSKVGIPNPHELCCKLLLTSRERNVCEVLGTSPADIFDIPTLDATESKQLFRARVGDKGQDEYIEDRMLRRCGGLPLSIVALADVLKNQELSMWEHYAIELEKPISIHGTIRGVNQQTYSILETSYKLMESEEKKMFFMLACLFPFGVSISVEDMMRYGIGLGLFQHVNSLTEAMEQAKTWVDELKSSSLLLEGYGDDDYVRIHDVVRASAISLAEKRGDKFMAEAIPRWMKGKTCQNYTAISLMPDTDHSCLIRRVDDGVNNFSKLRTLILDKTQPRVIDDAFFQSGMSNLEVLVLKSMERVSCSLESIKGHGLKSSLTTLHLIECKSLGDVRWIGELGSLFDLSLCGSAVKEIPEAMSKLCNLCVLDLRECNIGTGGIAANIVASMSQLEGLYAWDGVTNWAPSVQESGAQKENTITEHIAGEDDGKSSSSSSSSSNRGEYKYASNVWLNKLRYLNVLEIAVRLDDLPTDGDKFVENLDQFHLQITTDVGRPWWICRNYSRIIWLHGLDLKRAMKKSCAKALVQKAEALILEEVEGLVEYLVDVDDEWSLEQQQRGRIDVELFRGIKVLHIFNYEDNGVDEGFSWTLFPNLEFLDIFGMQSMRRIIKPSPPTPLPAGRINTVLFFSKLQYLTLNQLPELHPCVMPIDVLPPNLTYLDITSCDRLKYIFGKNSNKSENESGENNNNINDDDNLIIPIEIIQLSGLPEVESVVEEGSRCSTNSAALFNDEKLIFEALENLSLDRCDEITIVWDMHIGHIPIPYGCSKEKSNLSTTRSFHNLKDIQIRACVKLKSVGWLCIAVALVQLEKLTIWKCEEMKEGIIITREEEESTEVSKMLRNSTSGDTLSLFPSLRSLSLSYCPKMERMITTPPPSKHKNSVSIGVVEFPSLKSLFISDCHQIQALSGPEAVTFRAPKLTQFIYDGKEQPMQQVGDDINRFFSNPYKTQGIKLQPSEGLEEIQEI